MPKDTRIVRAGDCLGPSFEGWTAHLGARLKPHTAPAGRLLLIQTDGGSAFGTIQPGSRRGLYNIRSNDGKEMKDTRVLSVVPVTGLYPTAEAA